MMNSIRIDINRSKGIIDRNIFGGFAEHLGRCIYGGIYEPGSPLADEDGFRRDVFESLTRLNMPLIRYPGGNYVSGYRWQDGVGPAEERRAQLDLAWKSLEPNTFGTNEFIKFCRKLKTEPYLAVNCGDGDMREARDWVEYCNGTQPTYWVKQRQAHGFPEPHNVKYWGIGNEVDGPWQIGYKTPQEYARALTEFAKVMKWIDPDIKLIASAVSVWEHDVVERAQLMIEQAGSLIDYLGLHWYVGNPTDDFATYMAIPEMLEERLSAYEGLIRALRLDNKLTRPLWIAVDEWNVWYRTHPALGKPMNNLEEFYNLEDALVVAMQLNLFIRHAASVKMANIAQIVNVIAPIFTNPNGHFLQTIFFPFELYSRTCGNVALDVVVETETFSTADSSGVQLLDVTATLDEQRNQLVVYVVNRSQADDIETRLSLLEGYFAGDVQISTVNGKDIKVENTFETPNNVGTTQTSMNADGSVLTYTFEAHSVTAMVCSLT
ncbi:MAG: alpha-L-arabinofuranosidase C-terminal domain-containing protein [Chloroflexota bacterium]